MVAKPTTSFGMKMDFTWTLFKKLYSTLQCTRQWYKR